MAGVKHTFNIVGYNASGEIKTLKKSIDAQKMISWLNEQESFINDNFSKISVERIKDNLKIYVNVDGGKQWIDKVSGYFKLCRKNTEKKSHCYHVVCEIYCEKLIPVCNFETAQSTVINSTKIYQNLVFEKMYACRENFRVAVLKLVDIATDKNNPEHEVKNNLYSHAFYPFYVNGWPDLTGTGMCLKSNYRNNERFTRVNFVQKVRTDTDGQNIYFANQFEVVNTMQKIVAEISKYGTRQSKQNGK